MTYKWNSADAETYAKAFSNYICEEYFKNQKTISGGEILKITEIKQLNLLVIRNLFEKWQEESSRLKSPYFDFDQDEVKTALADFMNTLSRFISVNREKFESLLTQATKDTLQLAVEPKSFFKEILRNIPDFKLNSQWIENNRKYFQIHKDILERMNERLNGSSVFANEGIEMLENIFENYIAEDTTNILEDFNDILELNLGSSSAKKSFFDEAFESNPIPKKKLNPTQELPEIAAQVSLQTPNKEPKKLEPLSLNDKQTNASKTLNDKELSIKSVSLLDRHGQSKINSLKNAVSLNERFLFINKLFNGNQDSYRASMEKLDAFTSLSEAQSHVVNEIAVQHKWNNDSEEAEAFYALLGRKFG